VYFQIRVFASQNIHKHSQTLIPLFAPQGLVKAKVNLEVVELDGFGLKGEVERACKLVYVTLMRIGLQVQYNLVVSKAARSVP
jgi:hypothetical protein